MQVIRRQDSWIRAAGVFWLLLLAGSALCSAQEPTPSNRSLKILYAGQPGSDREKDFVGFLRKYFEVV